jgi:two-component system, OmpR family, osmolarity sensor histidine kinase EnvZ
LRISFNIRTLFARTALAQATAFIIFALFTFAVLHYMLVQPQSRQAADDLAALIVLSAQIWVELPPTVRPDFERELSDKHNLKVIRTEAPHPIRSTDYLYFEFLEESLKKRLGKQVPVHRHEVHSDRYWVDFPMGGHIMRIGFHESRLKNQMMHTLIAVISTGLLIAFALSLILVRRISRPLEKMAHATYLIGKGEFGDEIPETGPEEIAELAKTINLMEKRIQQLLENRTTLLAGISHDLRTPISRIKLQLEMLDGKHDEKRIAEIQNDLSEMDHLISQTLLLARGLNEDEKTETDINRIIHSVVNDLCRGNAKIEFTPSKKCIHFIRADALKRVLINLIENALTYSDGLPVSVTCKCNSQAGTTISVSDQGPGIPSTEHKAVFQPFYRLEGSRSKATGGSGLGLAIVRQLCDANGWNTEISSPVHGGTKVEIQLPRPDDQG